MSKFGFFLIFLSIIVVLGVVFYITQPLKMISQTNDRQRIKDLQDIASGLERFREAYGFYPYSDKGTYKLLTIDKESLDWGASFSPFLNKLPKDPDAKRRYIYWSDEQNRNKTFKIYASLEDPLSIESSCGESDCPGVPASNLCGEGLPCNYGITSGNVSP